MATDIFILLVQCLQITVATSLIFLSGLSSCLSLWVLPLTSLLPPSLACAQFTQTVTWGLHYLQPSSRILAFLLLTTTLLTSPYEVFCIFPINDRVKEIEVEVKRDGDEKEAKRELERLFAKWQFRNFGRVGIPLVAGVVGWLGVVRQ